MRAFSFVLLSLMAVEAALGGVVGGRVATVGGEPLAGVPVSDGYQIVYTDADGRSR